MTIPTPLFRELKAKKAKYGFTIHVSVDTMEGIGNAISVVRKFDPSALMEMVSNMGRSDFKIYCEHEGTAALIRTLPYNP